MIGENFQITDLLLVSAKWFCSRELIISQDSEY